MENEDINQNQMKAIQIKLKLNETQKKIIDEWFATTNYVYNKTLNYINNKHKINFQSLRDKIVTNNSRKNNKNYSKITSNIKNIKKMIIKLTLLNKNLNNNELFASVLTKNNIEINELNIMLEIYKMKLKSIETEKNTNIKEWELNTPKEIRAAAVNDICKAHITGFSNLKAGNISFFNMEYRKRKDNTSILIPKNFIKNNKNNLEIAPQFLKENNKLKIGKKSRKKLNNIKIEHDSRITKKNNEYWINIPISISIKLNKKEEFKNYCGIDPGCRTFMTSFGNKDYIEYKHNHELIKRLNKKIQILKAKRTNRKDNQKKGYRKRSIRKIEKRKSNLIDELHWKTINEILSENDVIFYGDIKSHNIVKHGKNKTLNTDVNDLKFYLFKTRLMFKAEERGKKVYKVNESYTSKTCSSCGTQYEIGSSKIYECKNKNCTSKNHVIDRDMNASKNILLKGIILNL
jgi:IS605 OrfB family transposase